MFRFDIKSNEIDIKDVEDPKYLKYNVRLGSKWFLVVTSPVLITQKSLETLLVG